MHLESRHPTQTATRLFVAQLIYHPIRGGVKTDDAFRHFFLHPPATIGGRTEDAPAPRRRRGPIVVIAATPCWSSTGQFEIRFREGS